MPLAAGRFRRADGLWDARLHAQRGRGGWFCQPEAFHRPVHPAHGRDERPQGPTGRARRQPGQGLHPLFQARADRLRGGGKPAARHGRVDGRGVLRES